MSNHTCPMSKIEYSGRCPVDTCPFNLWNEKADENCLHQNAENVDPVVYLSNYLGLSQRDVRSRIEQQTQNLIDTATSFSSVMQTPVRHSCPNCGYVRECQNEDICASRKRVTDRAMAELNNTLTPAELWHTLLIVPYRFLSPKLAQQAEAVLNMADVPKTLKNATPAPVK